ncbi:Hypothetical protein Tpal_680 [Trichococcus palustris]|uniref:Uncharacterized protein n=2 Tax=Trichococcus palustris TaxID=140314 RepID=A0A143YD72_9LACT|nr:Hypothetical protein Tpal_680 [Trichococcus palustris]SFK56835.1 hypothetical protein SAMN04488076_101163 [Trichococcus palustris]
MADQAARITWFVTVVALFIIGGIEYYINDTGMNILLVIASLSVSLILLLERYYLSKANGDNTFNKVIVAALIIVVIILGIAFLV